ncbi:MAG: T9SS type A sorting domain-containing protein [candidate division WOR-3 bacterium]|nr:MAG: T9SS type A sorting domain-containing protein [candidate division WOR-3 bacterium]
MKSIIFVIVGILVLTTVSVAEPVGDQEVYGSNEAVVTPASTGDKNLIETGGFPLPESTVPFSAECDVTSNRRVPGIIQYKRHGSGTNPDWGTDILVIDDTLASDPHLLRTAGGDLYVVYKYMGPLISANSSVTICRSTDNGESWSWTLDASVDDTTEIYNLDVIMEDETDSTFIFAICNAQGDDIWLLRYNITAGTTDWVEVTTGFVFDPAIDQLESATSHYMYMAYCVYDTILRFRASSDWGATWTSSYGVHGGATVHNPDIRMLAADEIWSYIVWDNGPITYSKANDYQGFAGWAGIAPHIHNFRGGSDDVNGQVTGYWDSDTVWVVAEENYNNTGDWNIVWDYTYDGINWRNDSMFPDIDLANDPARDEKYFKLLVDFEAANQARVVYNTQTTTADTRVDYQFCQYGGWTTTEDLSDHLAKVGTAPSVNDLTAAGGGVIAYCGYNAIWFDYYWNTAVQELPINEPQIRDLLLSPTISKDVARLSFTIHTPGFVSVSLYDAAGRMVNNPVAQEMTAGNQSVSIDARNLSAGIYFVRVESPDGVGTEMMTIVR